MFVVPVTLAVKVWLCPTATLTAGGETDTLTLWGVELVLAQPATSEMRLSPRRNGNIRRMKDLAVGWGRNFLLTNNTNFQS